MESTILAVVNRFQKIFVEAKVLYSPSEKGHYGMAESEVQLGDKVQDRVSSFTGIVNTVGDHLAGCRRIGALPLDTEDPTRKGDEEFFYEDQLEILEEEYWDESPETETDFQLGEIVRDEVTGFKGVVHIINFHLWNCPQILVKRVDEEGSLESEWFDEPQLQKEGVGFVGYYDEEQNSDNATDSGSIEDSRNRNLKR